MGLTRVNGDFGCGEEALIATHNVEYNVRSSLKPFQQPLRALRGTVDEVFGDRHAGQPLPFPTDRIHQRIGGVGDDDTPT